jgi:hypothetical protein
LLRIAPRSYYEHAGFEVTPSHVRVRNFFGRTSALVPREDIAGVTTAYLRMRGGDWRTLLVDQSGAVLGRVGGAFYSDPDLERLADELHVPYRVEEYRWPAALEDAHPGATPINWGGGRRFSTSIAILVIAVLALCVVAAALMTH